MVAGSIALCKSAPKKLKVNGFYSGLRPIFQILLTNQQTTKQKWVQTLTSLVENDILKKKKMSVMETKTLKKM